jgi:hypothetical protein
VSGEGDDGGGQLDPINLLDDRVVVEDSVLAWVEMDVDRILKHRHRDPVLGMVQLETYVLLSQ